MKTPGPRTAESGQALITAIIFLLALTFMGFGLVAMSTVDTASSRNLRVDDQALSAAEEGVALGMSWATNPATTFIGLGEGGSVHLKSTVNAGKNIHDRLQYEVSVFMGGQTQAGSGEQQGKSGGKQISSSFKLIKVDSVGMVGEGAGRDLTSIATFDWTKRPMVRKRLEVVISLLTYR